MQTFKVAHVRQRGVNLILVPFDSSFNYKPEPEKNSIVIALQIAAAKKGLSGTVIPVWLKENAMRFIAPTDWYPMLRNLVWNDVLYNINRELTIAE